MDNLEIAVIVAAIAVVQALTILLTFRRERDVRELRELVEEQRLRLAELRAWLAGRNAASKNRIKSEPEPIHEPTAGNMRAPEPAITPKDLPEAAPEEQTARVTKAIDWLNEVENTQPRRMKPDGGQPMADVPALAIVPKDLSERPRLTEDEIKEIMGADKAREIVAVLHGRTSEKIGSTTKPITTSGTHTAQEIDAEVLEMQRLELPVMPGQEHAEACNRLTLKKQGNTEALKNFDGALIKMGNHRRRSDDSH